MEVSKSALTVDVGMRCSGVFGTMSEKEAGVALGPFLPHFPPCSLVGEGPFVCVRNESAICLKTRVWKDVVPN